MTWTRCSNWLRKSPCCRRAAFWSKAPRKKSKATRSCRKPISVECSNNELARSQRTELVLRRLPHPVRRRPQGRKERGGGAARPQWRRQEHHAEKPDGRGEAARRFDHARRRTTRRQ